MIKIYGIKNCNTVKKAIDWLNYNNIPFEFYDYKKQSITKEKLNLWEKQLGWETLLNKKGTTWRKLNEEDKKATINASKAIDLMLLKNSLIKRPLIEKEEIVLAIGFDEQLYQKVLK